MNEVLPTQIENSEQSVYEQFKDFATNARTKLGRISMATLMALTSGVGTFAIEELANPTPANAEATTYTDLGYPWKDAPCQFGTTGGTSCTNPKDSTDKYDWGIYDAKKVFHPYRNGYEYRNCTDYVQWKESTIGVSVPSNWGNGGQWYDSAPTNEKTTMPKAGDAAVVPGNPGHVAYVESVNADGTITVSEYNHNVKGDGDLRTGKATDMGFTKFIDFGVHPTEKSSSSSNIERPRIGDFNADGRIDAAVFRPSDGSWHVKAVGDYAYGAAGDIPVPGDYNADKKTDVAIFRPSDGSWHIRAVGDYSYGQPGDIPVPGDYNGDNKTDIAVYRPSDGTWHVRTLADYSYGQPGDIPVPGYYNQDKIEDLAVYRPSEGGWHIRGVGDYPYGASTDIPVPADYTGDGITDRAVYRPDQGGWHINAFGDFPYGAATDVPVPGYYDDDNKEDAAIYRPGEGGWHINGVGDYPYGASTDIPANQTLNAFLLKQYGLIPSY